MKARVILFYLLFLSITAFCQSSTIDLTFTAVNNTTHIQMDSIKVMNRTQGGDTVLYWPDTVLSLYFTDIPEHEQQASGFIVFQNYPNPVTDLTTISIYLPEKDEVTMTVMDLLGRLMYKTEKVLDKGSHSFRFSPGNDNLYFFTGHWRGNTSSIKILHAPTNSNSILSMEYLGSINSNPQLKLMEETQDFNYAFGDELLYIAYIDTLESGFPGSPEESQTYTFQFATNIPCPGTPVITYEGKTYNTIQIFSQCWLKENINAGMMIPKDQWMEENGVLEKFCYNDNNDSCEKYGGLYQWDEMMQYALLEGVQGICPSGWHVPTDQEWQVLEGAVDSQYGIGDNVWMDPGDRGHDAGNNLKTISGWVENGNGIDKFGFNGLPGGWRVYNGIFYFSGLHYVGWWWTSTKNYNTSFLRDFSYDKTSVHRMSYFREYGLSVRCLRNENYITPIELTFTGINNISQIQLDSIKVINQTKDALILMIWPDTSLALAYELEFEPGDVLLMIGYSDTLQSGITDSPTESESYTFQFATNIPCPGTPVVEYGGQVYNTIQIFSQCWLEENLNIGVIPAYYQKDNGIIEKYCYNNQLDSCAKYGGLYNWYEMMQYTTEDGTRGICPPDWHLPEEDEWKVLEGAVDSQYKIGDSVWYTPYETFRGYDAGSNLKSSSGWMDNGNGVDRYGFSALPGGFAESKDESSEIGIHGLWWGSSEYSGYPFIEYRHLSHDDPRIERSLWDKSICFSVRCVRDDIYFNITELSFTALDNLSYRQLDSVKVFNMTTGMDKTLYWPDTTLFSDEINLAPGDELRLIGYSDNIESGLIDIPEGSKSYTFEFATNIPCPGSPTVFYHGQEYNTIQVYSQCWLKENLNVGEKINGTLEQSDNGTIEKYCYNDELDSCAKYGGLYQWNEMMQYSTREGARGICPPGWHLPTDDEWKILEGVVDSQYRITDPEWDLNGEGRGFDAGLNLKASGGWTSNGNGTDLFGFAGMPGGKRNPSTTFKEINDQGYWWSSSKSPYGIYWNRSLSHENSEVNRSIFPVLYGFSLRCLRDE